MLRHDFLWRRYQEHASSLTDPHPSATVWHSSGRRPGPIELSSATQPHGEKPLYRNRVPAYVYTLPCGVDHTCRTFTRSEPDSDLHWFWCDRCADYTVVPVAELVEHRPNVGGTRPRPYGDGELARLMDTAILKDRVAAVLVHTWGSMPISAVMSECRASERLVCAVAADLGIYESALRA